ncbi:MAG: hypothetical protein IKO91_08380 [Oscillospiraceae bacterium]|nr:hypothetical protein [Oscillospiraceae bacterium]
MSLFRPYVYKPRPDLLDNAPVKKGFFRFFEIYFRKFWRFLTLNLLYFLITLPMLLYVFYTVNGIFAERLEAMGEGVILFSGISFLAVFFDFVPRVLNIPLLIISVLLYGPITMGLTYIFRNFAREEHAWTSDLWSRAWSNARQGLFFGIADILVLWLCVNGAFFDLSSSGALWALSAVRRVLSVLALVIWVFMRHYTYLMAVTVNLSVFRILKNAWLFVVLGFGRNVLSTLVTLGCLFLSFFLVPLLTVVTLPLFFYSFTWFCTIFTCYPIVKKYIIVPALEAESGQTGQKDPAPEPGGPMEEPKTENRSGEE